MDATAKMALGLSGQDVDAVEFTAGNGELTTQPNEIGITAPLKGHSMKLLHALVAVVLAFAVTPALADNYVAKDGNGTIQTMGAKTFDSVLYPTHVCAGVYSSSLVLCNVDASGNQGVNVENTVAVTGTFWQTTQPVSIAQTTPGTTNGVQDAADGATGATAPTKAQLAGCDAINAEPSAASNGQMVAPACTLTGKAINLPYANKENFVRGSASATGTGATTIIAAQGAGVKTYITSVACGRTDAGTSAISLTLGDGASTVLVLPDNGGGGGNNMTFPVPLVTAANSAFTFTASAGVTTLYCSAQGYTGS